MGDKIDRDAVLALVSAHIKDARRTYAGIHQAQEPLAFVGSLLSPAIAALPAAEPAEDVRAGALKEAAKRISELMLPETNTQMGISYNMGLGVAYDAILALIPGAKP